MRQKKLALDKVDEVGKLVTRREKKTVYSLRREATILEEKGRHLEGKRPPSW